MSFFHMLGMFDPGDGPRGPRRDSGATDDDPVIVDVQADGDDHGETPSAGKGEPPKRGVPRLTPRPLPNGPSKGTKILIGVVLALVVVVGLFFGLSQFITDLMWYGQLGFQNVVWTQLGVKFGLWAAYALLMALVSYVSAWLAIRARPDSSDGSTFRIKDDVIEVGKSFSSKTARRAAVVVSLVVGVMFGSQFNSNWSEILLMFNAQSFGTADPQFGIDNGFYVFVLPGLRLVMSAVSMLLLMGIVFSVVTHAMMGGIRFTMPVHGRGVLAVTKRARRQIGIWLILNMLAWSARQVIGVFTHLTQQGDRITGAAYTTVHATIPVTFIMAAITAMLGVFLGVWLMRAYALEGASKPGVRGAAGRKALRTPVIAVAGAVVVSLVRTVAWPMLLQRFKAGGIRLLVATTVIEVGVDVPNASLMIIENAERLGLSQMHQLRGRVGRGQHASACVLMYHPPLSETAKARLRVLRDTTDGFEVARRDLELRGPGELLGTRQAGLLSLKVADLLRDADLLPRVQRAAEALLARHPANIPPLLRRWIGGGARYGKV